MKQFEYTIKAMSKLYASWAFFPRSTFSTAFQSVSWSAYSGGAWAGSRIAYDISRHPDFKQTMDMLDRAFEKIPDNSGAILYSDQGWQYQMKHYQQRLQEKGIVQSMSRKGNCYDNAMMENFFGLLKTEMFYGRKFRDAKHLISEIKKYIDYYNNNRIKLRLKGRSPVQYRTHFAEAI